MAAFGMLVAFGETYRQLIPKPELTVIPSTGHAPYVEEPQRFADEVCAFLNRACS